MAVLRSLLFTLLFYPGTLLYVLATLAVSPFGSRPVQAVVHGWAAFHHVLVRHVLGIRFEMQGSIPPGPHLIALKHQAMVETIEALQLADTPVVVMKRELTVIPLFGPVAVLYGVIGVDREAGASALREMMVQAKEAIAKGRPVVIFPEGTRVPPGEQPPLKPGFAGLYRALGLPVVPVALDSGRIWPRSLVKQPGVIHLLLGETIPPGLKRDEVERRVHAAINALEVSSAAGPQASPPQR
ncbi:lysophospholipid acyltransferase family protein [Sphingomonas sp. GCM10030256]|uniref:lysophospholipid acyltransferase family protein n=1 Tax=Sphingomonas sp. GCM10030256 TaxID=3273427 RepID=UPI0036130CE9